jgi:hypothetical protein
MKTCQSSIKYSTQQKRKRKKGYKMEGYKDKITILRDIQMSGDFLKI